MVYLLMFHFQVMFFHGLFVNVPLLGHVLLHVFVTLLVLVLSFSMISFWVLFFVGLFCLIVSVTYFSIQYIIVRACSTAIQSWAIFSTFTMSRLQGSKICRTVSVSRKLQYNGLSCCR